MDSFGRERMDAGKLQSALQQALDTSLAWSRVSDSSRLRTSNAARSGFFCHEAGKRLASFAPKGSKLLQIGFRDKEHEFESGEWMLDGAIVEYDKDERFIRRIHIAMESESSTSLAEVAKDFSKLLNVKARTKIYLHGLDHATAATAEKLINERLGIASALIQECDPYSEWFIAFWPSPRKMGELPSLWDALGKGGRFAHLAEVRLYSFDGKEFDAVTPGDKAAPALEIAASAACTLADTPSS